MSGWGSTEVWVGPNPGGKRLRIDNCVEVAEAMQMPSKLLRQEKKGRRERSRNAQESTCVVGGGSKRWSRADAENILGICMASDGIIQAGRKIIRRLILIADQEQTISRAD